MTSARSTHPKASRIGQASSMIPLILFIGLALIVPRTAAGDVLRFRWDWIPSLGIELSFLVDGLSLLFALIICGVGFFVSIYSGAYLSESSQLGRFYAFLHGFLLAMLGLVAADNLLTLFVFWELTTLLSYLLIGFENESETARNSARQALLVTGAGGLVLLIGMLLLAMATDTYTLSELGQSTTDLRQHALYLPILICFLIGAFTKSAQFPFHFWLPNAMTAPTPISAFLHSATMVKAGIYLLARMHPVLGGTPAWMATLVVVGGVTGLLGSVLAMGQSDLKRILAYTTLMALGILTMFLGGKTTPALTAAMTFVLVHSLYKSALFLVVGIIDHQTGTRELDAIGGLFKPLPLTALAAAAAALSMAGFPLFLGFIGKEIMYKGALTEEMFPEFSTIATLLSNALMTAVAGILVLRPFLGRRRETPLGPVEAPAAMWIGPAILGGIGLGFGTIPGWVARWLVEPAVKAFHPTTEDIQLKLFHGINEPLLLSIVTLTLGSLLYLKRRTIRRVLCRLLERMPFSFARLYDAALVGLAWMAKAQTSLIQSGSLHRYLVVVIGTVTFGIGIPFVGRYFSVSMARVPDLAYREWLIVVLMLAAVVVVISARSRLLAICGLGTVGASVAVIFLIYGAPDLALTQLLVETLTVILVSLVLLRLPRLMRPGSSGRHRRWFDGMLAVSTGLLVTTLVLAVTQTDLDRSLTYFFESRSYLEAHGRNIVNVILVDFRSMDTLGEIIVVAVAGLSGYALIHFGRKA